MIDYVQNINLCIKTMKIWVFVAATTISQQVATTYVSRTADQAVCVQREPGSSVNALGWMRTVCSEPLSDQIIRQVFKLEVEPE